jgi:hypothetical protein
MKKYTVYLMVCFLFLACSKDEDVIVNQLEVDYLKYTLRQKNNPVHWIYIQEYTFENKKVITENYLNSLYPQHNSNSAFLYDDQDRVISEMRNGELYRKIEWNNNNAKVYDSEDNLKGEFKFKDSRLEYYVIRYELNDIRFRKLNYYANGNVKSIQDENKILVEYLDYDTSVFNPMNLINSIAILRIDYKPHFTNLFSVEKVHPFRGDDYSQPLRFYNYDWTLNTENLVETIEDQKSAIYTRAFQYH